MKATYKTTSLEAARNYIAANYPTATFNHRSTVDEVYTIGDRKRVSIFYFAVLTDRNGNTIYNGNSATICNEVREFEYGNAF